MSGPQSRLIPKKEWLEEVKKAVNYKEPLTAKPVILHEDTVKIRVAEVIGVGHDVMMPPEVALVRDTKGTIWVLEATSSTGVKKGLASLWDVRPGMELELYVKRILEERVITEVFVLSK